MMEASSKPTEPLYLTASSLLKKGWDKRTVEEYLEMLPQHLRATQADHVCCYRDTDLGQLIWDYYAMHRIETKVYSPDLETEAERKEREETFHVGRRHLLAHQDDEGRLFVEVHRTTIWRALRDFGVVGKGGAKKTVEQHGKIEVNITDRGLESNREPQTPQDYETLSRSIAPDRELLYHSSIEFIARSKEHDIKGTGKSLEQLFYELLRQSNARLRVPDNCEATFMGRIAATMDAKNGEVKRTTGFPGGASVFGISGVGIGFAIGAINLGRANVYYVRVSGPDAPVAKYDKITPEGGDKRETTLRLNLDTASPCWNSLERLPVPIRDPEFVAVSAQRRTGDAAYGACLGATMDTNNVLERRSSMAAFIYRLPLTATGKPKKKCASCLVVSRLPFAGIVPTFIAVSTRLLVAVFNDAVGTEGDVLPPHMWVMQFEEYENRMTIPSKGSSSLDGWYPFLIELPTMPADEPTPEVFQKLRDSGKLPAITCGSFDAYDPYELLLGTYHGVSIPMRFHRSGSSNDLHCNNRGIAPYIVPGYLAQLKRVNDEVEFLMKAAPTVITEEHRRHKLDQVGRLRAPITSIVCSHGTHGGKDGPDCWWGNVIEHMSDSNASLPVSHFASREAFRTVFCFSTGYAWQIGDSSTHRSISARGIMPYANRYMENPMIISACTLGSVLVVHEGVHNSIVVVDMSSNVDCGSFRDPTLEPALLGKERHVYQSTWMDLGRIAAVFPDGEILIVTPASDEKLLDREKALKEEEERIVAARKAEHEKQMKELEERTSKMKVAEKSVTDTVVAAATSSSPPTQVSPVVNSDVVMSEAK